MAGGRVMTLLVVLLLRGRWRIVGKMDGGFDWFVYQCVDEGDVESRSFAKCDIY